MEKRTGKVGKKKTFIFFSYLMATDVQDIWLLRVWSNISETLFSFYNFVKHSWSCWLSLICEFKNVFLTHSQHGFAGFSVSILFLLCDSFAQHFAAHWEFWINIGYWTILRTQKLRNTQLPLNYILLCHTTLSLQYLESSKMLRIEGCHWWCQGKFKPWMVISLLSLLFSLTFGKGILMSSVAPFKGFGFRNPANFGIRNPDYSTACNPKSKIVLHILTLGHIGAHWGKFNLLAVLGVPF